MHYHLRTLLENPALAKIVAAKYAQPALPPAMPWMGSKKEEFRMQK